MRDKSGLDIDLKKCDIIITPPFRCKVVIDTNTVPQLKNDKNKIAILDAQDTMAAFMSETDEIGAFYIWVGNPKLAHAEIAHECLHLVDAITRHCCNIPTQTPVLGDLADETRAHLLTYLYERVQEKLIKRKKYPKG